MKSGSTNEHKGSDLLKPEENEQVFRLIGNRCQCLAAGVIQLYLTEPPSHREWLKRNTGVITLIRDNPRRSFFFRLYCLQRKAMLWEQEVYDSMDYKSPRSYFHTFEGEECMAAFNFASETDALTLRNILLGTLNTKRQRRQERHSRKEADGHHGQTLPRKSHSSTLSFGFPPSTNSHLPNGSSSSVNVNRSVSSSSVYKTKKSKSKRNPKRSVTKDDISLPSDFRHVTHVGWNPNSTGLELDSVDIQVKQIYNKAGMTEYKMRNLTREKFTGTHGNLRVDLKETVTSSNMQGSFLPTSSLHSSESPPPIPARTMLTSSSSPSNSNQTRSAPPLPPSRTNAPLLPPRGGGNAAASCLPTVPSRPPAPSTSPALSLPPTPPPPPPPPPPPSSLRDNSSNAIPPPPPPPLPSFTDADSESINRNTSTATTNSNNNNNGDIPDPRTMLMESIRGGTTLKKVVKNDAKPTPVGDVRNDLLHQIRQGIELKPVANEPRPNVTTTQQDGIVGAIKRALAERSRAIYSESESEDSTSDTSEDDEWDD